eukprot:2793606-Rhodomonas_salina.2
MSIIAIGDKVGSHQHHSKRTRDRNRISMITIERSSGKETQKKTTTEPAHPQDAHEDATRNDHEMQMDANRSTDHRTNIHETHTSRHQDIKPSSHQDTHTDRLR